MTQPDRTHRPRENVSKPTWTDDRLFVSPDGKLAVKVSKGLKGNDRFPMFNMELVAFDLAPGPLTLGVPRRTFTRLRLPFDGRKTGRITIQRIGSTVANLFEQAEDYIAEQLQTAENDWIEWSEQKALRDDARSKPVQRPGLKKLAKTGKP